MHSNPLEIWQVDVFTERPLSGNPVAVVFFGSELSDADLQKIARETNLSETTFVLPSRSGDATHRVRFFTTRREIRYSAHAALGTAHAISGRFGAAVVPPYRIDCDQGALILNRGSKKRWSVSMPHPEIRAAPFRNDELSAMLGVPEDRLGALLPTVVSVGVSWLLVSVRSLEDLENLDIDYREIARASRASGIAGVCVFTIDCGQGFRARLRSFAPAEGIFEDPVCGSCHACVAALLVSVDNEAGAGVTGSIAIREGLGEFGRGESVVEYQFDGAGKIRMQLEGDSVTVMKGTLFIREDPGSCLA